MNEEIKTEVEAAARIGKTNRVDTSALPKVDMAKVVVARNKATDNKKGYVATGFSVLVFVNGKWRLQNDVLHHFGVKSHTAVFKTYEKAKEEIEKIKKTWGVAIEANAAKAKGPTKAELAAQVADLQAKLAAALQTA